MVKAKSKAERAAARAALSGTPGGSKSHVPVDAAAVSGSGAPGTAVVNSQDEGMEGTSTSSPSQVALDEPHVDGQSRAPSVAGEAPEGANVSTTSGDPSINSSKDKEKEKHKLRLSLLKERSSVVLEFMKSIVPILVDVYAASVALQVRSRSLAGILKAISWLDGGDLNTVLKVSQPYLYEQAQLTHICRHRS